LKLIRALIGRFSFFAIPEKTSRAKEVFNQGLIKETHLYEESVVAYVDKVARLNKLIDAGVVGRLYFRLGANGWI
jgi:hypothetical protein